MEALRAMNQFLSAAKQTVEREVAQVDTAYKHHPQAVQTVVCMTACATAALFAIVDIIV
jgi:hypothetical protein